MKNLITKLFAVIFTVILAAGCASSITAPEEIQSEKEITKKEAPAPGDITAGDNMEEDVERPDI